MEQDTINNHHAELFARVPGFGGIYTISNRGRLLKKTPRGEVQIMGSIDGKYVQVKLMHKGRYRATRIHVLVAEAFCQKPVTNKKLCVNHIDENGLNNRADNLQWLTIRQNLEYSIERNGIPNLGEKHPQAKLNSMRVNIIRKYYRVFGKRGLGRLYNISPRTIRDAYKGITWGHVN